MSIHLNPIGFVDSPRKEKKDDYWAEVISVIQLDESVFNAEAIQGIETFSHLEIIFYMDQVLPEKIVYGARHPRNDSQLPKVGIFAQRGKSRPNRIGLSRCNLLKTEGTRLYVQGLDAIDQTPILDIKPYVQEFAPRGTVFQPTWISEIMRNYY